MSNGEHPTKALIAGERRRRICDWVMEHGSANISALAEALGVTENTIRNDLDLLHDQGKLIRSRGGAMAKERQSACPPYSEERTSHKREKSLIGAAALRYLPDSGSIFINAGTTTYEMAVRIPQGRQIQVTTNSPEIALHLASNAIAPVHLLGGWVNPETLGADYSLSADLVQKFYWEACFMGVSAFDITRGITAINLNLAQSERAIMDCCRKVVVLCDSSKLGRCSHVQVAPASIVDVLITDSGIDPDLVQELQNEGVEVVVEAL
ncbi:MAG: DeoR/GlpR family DNA-binding transcription regulator [Armatimonadota bacterium]